MAQPQLKLTYFAGPGAAELARLAFVVGGIAFDDHRIDHAAFAPLKPTLPLGQVPVLEIDGVTYTQSMAHARYAAKLAGLVPEDALEGLKVDMIMDTLSDVRTPAGEIRWRPMEEAEKAEKTKKLLDETVPKYFAYVEKFITGTFLLGDKLSLADLAIFNTVENALKANFPDFDVSKYAKIEALYNGVKANERVAAYLAK